MVKASLTAVSELLISCGIGALATRKGILDKVVISSLSKVRTVRRYAMHARRHAQATPSQAQANRAEGFAAPLI